MPKTGWVGKSKQQGWGLSGTIMCKLKKITTIPRFAIVLMLSMIQETMISRDTPILFTVKGNYDMKYRFFSRTDITKIRMNKSRSPNVLTGY